MAVVASPNSNSDDSFLQNYSLQKYLHTFMAFCLGGLLLHSIESSRNSQPLSPQEQHNQGMLRSSNDFSIIIPDVDKEDPNNPNNHKNPDATSSCPFVPPSKNSLEWGGWEYTLDFIKEQHIRMSPNMGKWLAFFMRQKKKPSIIDVGCGVGQLKVALTQNGKLPDKFEYVGLDGGSNIMELEGTAAPVIGDPNHVIPPLCWVDASMPFDLGRKFDIVFSSEVGEHIPRAGEQNFLDNLVRLVDNDGGYLFLSWAHIGQGGFRHNNERDLPYLIDQLERRGMTFKNQETNNFRIHFVPGSAWKNNLLIFQKENTEN